MIYDVTFSLSLFLAARFTLAHTLDALEDIGPWILSIHLHEQAVLENDVDIAIEVTIDYTSSTHNCSTLFRVMT